MKGKCKKMKLKVMTFNIEHGLDYADYRETKKEKINLDLSAEIINNEDADIICINEVRGLGKHPAYNGQDVIMSEKTNRNVVFSKCIEFEQFGPYGDALLSRFPVDNYTVIDIPDPEMKDEDEYYETRKLLKAEINLEKKITVFISHFGLAKAERRNAVEVLINELKKVDTPVIFMGDLNMTPDCDIIRPIYRELKEVYTQEGPFTYRTPDPEQKIDYIFVSKDIEVKAVKTIEKMVSDHFPVVAEIEI